MNTLIFLFLNLYFFFGDCETRVNIGHMLGINVTPAMVLEDGTVIPGYMTADDLVKGLEKLKKKS